MTQAGRESSVRYRAAGGYVTKGRRFQAYRVPPSTVLVDRYLRGRARRAGQAGRPGWLRARRAVLASLAGKCTAFTLLKFQDHFGLAHAFAGPLQLRPLQVLASGRSEQDFATLYIPKRIFFAAT